jgi:tetratricopeptide (TPR) repeat protein
MGEHFFSYSSDGSQLARRLREALGEEPEPIKTITYEDDKLPAYQYQLWIEETIPRCSTVLLVLTELSRDSLQCLSELERAYRLGLPNFVLVLHDVDPPHLAYDSDRVIFTRHAEPESFQVKLAELRQKLTRLETPAGQQMLLRYRIKAAKREVKGATGSRQRGLLERIAYLQGQWDELQPAVEDEAVATVTGRRRIARDIRLERSSRTATEVHHGVRFVRPLPRPPREHFLDRQVEREQLRKLLGEQELCLIAVLGRHGIGKSATVCSVLQQAGGNGARSRVAAGVAYRSTHGVQRVTAANLLDDLRAMVPQASLGLADLVANPDLTSMQKLDGILGELGATPVILAVDDAEDLLDEDRTIKDPELALLLNTLLLREDHAVKMVLVSDTPPAELLSDPSAADLPLDRGLSPDDAQELLRQLDEDGFHGLAELPRPLLEQIHERTGGHPRALELLFAILDADHVTTPQQLLDVLAGHPDDDPAAVLLGQLLGRLIEIEQLVVTALAVYGRPVIPAAVNYLLHRKYPVYDSAKTLAKLAKGRLVREEEGRYYLPTLDRFLVLNRIDLGQPEDREAVPPPFKGLALFHQAAEYFSRLKSTEVKTINDLDAHLAEIDLRILAQEYRPAYRLLHEVDTTYLRPWGYHRVLYQYRSDLRGKLGRTTRLEMVNLDALALAEEESDHPTRALELYAAAFAIARRRNAPEDIKKLHVNLAGSYLKDELVDHALDEYRQALDLAREQGRPDEQAIPLAGICLCLAKKGRFEEAFRYHAEALAIARRLEKRRLEAELELNVGVWEGELGRLDLALLHLRRGRSLAEKVGDQLTAGLCLSGIAEVLVDQGRVGRAAMLAGEAIAVGERLGSPHLLREGCSTLAMAQLCKGALEDARQAATAGCRYDSGRRSLYIRFLRGLLTLRGGDVDEALFDFEEVSARAKALRDADGDASFFALYLSGLALSGRIACGQDQYLGEAEAAFRLARGLTAEWGVVIRTLRLLDELRSDDDLSPALAAARSAAAGVDVQPPAATGTGT